MSKGTIRKFFPGGNTCYGFYSLYDNIIQQKETVKKFVIKGGPGVGKSTFMKNLGNEMINRGFNIEHHCCSSDNHSLDGLLIKELNILLVDGTAPHMIDPKNPGAIDEIINFGDHWDEQKLITNKQEIMHYATQNSQAFKSAYYSLRAAKVLYDEWISYISQITDFIKVNKTTYDLINQIFKSVKPEFNVTPKRRELFASATTPNGLINEWPSILQNCKNIFWLQGEPGTGKSTFIRKIIVQAVGLGLDTEIFRHSFDPVKYSGVYIPSLQTAVVSPFPTEYKMESINKNITFINFNTFLNTNEFYRKQEEINEAKQYFWIHIERAIRYIAKAKKIHDTLESYYVSAMNFDEINKVQQKTITKILKYIK